MVWSGTSIEEAKLRFIADRLSGEFDDMSALCASYGISRQTGYELMQRYAREGLACARARSHAPHHHGRTVDEAVMEAVLECRLAHPTWGPRKLLAYLRRHAPDGAWPAASTIGDHLQRHGLIRLQRRRRARTPLTRPFAQVDGPNSTWSLDFKGWARTGNGERFVPLTVCDNYSRFLLECRILEPVGAAVGAAMERLMRDVGLPQRLRMDNGAPWASLGPAGLSRLSVQWIKLGIELEFIEPGQPQQNGRLERLHETLKAQTMRPPAATKQAQQQRFDAFRREYNEERPHEALGQQPPASLYTLSSRHFPRKIEDPHYEGDEIEVRRVRSNGEIKWRGGMVYIGQAFVGELVALQPDEHGAQVVHFASTKLGMIDHKTQKFRSFGPPRPGRTKAGHREKRTAEVSPI